MKKIKVEDIAAKADVSITAVSFALNNKPGVSQETAQKILRIARELHYPIPQQNIEKAIVQVIKIVKHGNILNEELNPFIMSYIEGMEQECTKQNCRMEIISHTKKTIKDIHEEMIESEAAGFVIIATELNRQDILEFSDIKRPLCFVDANYHFMPFSFVDIDNINSVGQVVRHLHKKGHRKIGMVSSKTITPNFEDREKAFVSSLEYYRLLYKKDFCFCIDASLQQGIVDTQNAINSMKELPTALFCINDSVAYATMKGIKNSGLNIPYDISIIGFDDLALSKLTDPPLTSVKISTTQIGIRTIQLLNQRIQLGVESMVERISISGTLIARDSVKEIIDT